MRPVGHHVLAGDRIAIDGHRSAGEEIQRRERRAVIKPQVCEHEIAAGKIERGAQGGAAGTRNREEGEQPEKFITRVRMSPAVRFRLEPPSCRRGRRWCSCCPGSAR